MAEIPYPELPEVAYVGPTLNAAQCESLRIVLDAHDGPLQIASLSDGIMLIAGPRRIRIQPNGTVVDQDPPPEAA